ncbi:longifolia 1-like protein [Tanacetum coccineum]
MATKVVYTLREDKQGLQKQLGCMNGVFQLFDRRYLLGLHRSRSHKRLTAGQGEKEFTDSSEKAKEKNPKKVMIEKNRASVESSRNSFSSSCSSTTGSSFDCSKRIQSEWQLPSEPTSPNLRKKQFLQPPDIRDVVKDSMTREIRVKKDERASPVMKHVDSPRPFIPQKFVQYDSKGRKLAKEASRLSCDERESQYSLKSTFKVKELPRLSLDSKQNSNRNSMNESRRSVPMKQVQGCAVIETSHEPGSNKRPSSGVVARLMGLESLTDSSSEVETPKIVPPLNDRPSSRWSRNGEEYKQNHGSVSPRVYLKIKPASQQQEDSDRVGKKTSVYGEMEKRLSALEFKTSGKDLRALKQILETMQTTRRVLENKEQSLDSQKSDQPGSPTVKKTISPKRREPMNQATRSTKMATETMLMTGIQNANHMAKKQVKDQSPRIKKSTDRKSRSVSPSNSPEYLTGEKPISSPRLQRSKNGVNKQCFQPKQSKVQSVVSEVKTRHPKINCINTTQNNEQRDLRQDNETVSLKSVTKIELEVTRNYRPKENRRVDKVVNNFAERLIEDEPAVELPRLTVEQPSPVSVLDAFYVEDTPSPVKNKPHAYNEYETSQVDERETNQVDIYDFANGTDTKLYSLLNQIKQENTSHLVHQIELLTSIDETAEPPYKRTNGDHRYISDILLTSGVLKDPDAAIRILQLHPTANLIKPELFNLLENSKRYTEIMSDECNKKIPRSTSYDRIRRKLIFDSVNEILSYKVAMWSRNRSRRLVDGEKLLQDLWSEIDDLQSSSDGCLYDEDDEVKNLVSADVNKSSEDWDKCCYEVSGVVLDIERLIFKDLIDEVVNAEASSLHRPKRHRRRLFSM